MDRKGNLRYDALCKKHKLASRARNARKLLVEFKSKSKEMIHLRSCNFVEVINLPSTHLLSRRTELLEALKMMEGGLLDGIIFENLDRISKDQEFNIRILKTAYKSNCAIIQVNKGFIDLRNRSDRMSITFENAMAEEAWFDLQKKVQWKSRSGRVMNGKDTQTVPALGLDAHPTQVEFYVVNPEEQKMVHEFYSLFARTSCYTIVETCCNEKGYNCKSRMTREKIDEDGNRVPPRFVGGGPLTKKAI